MIAGAVMGLSRVVTAAAIGFALASMSIAAAWSFGRGTALQAEDAAARRSPSNMRDDLADGARLFAIAYGWGALAMQGLYVTPLTGLRWQHGWQYALAMVLLLLLSTGFERSVRRKVSGPPSSLDLGALGLPLAVAQGGVAAIGLAALVVSGKLWSVKVDWAANRVFAGLAIAVLALSLATLYRSRQQRR
jgi:hypothetical protein